MSGKFGGPIFCIYKYDMLPSINSNCDCELLYECYFLSHLMVVRVISFEEMKISFSNCLPCLLSKNVKGGELTNQASKMLYSLPSAVAVICVLRSLPLYIVKSFPLFGDLMIGRGTFACSYIMSFPFKHKHPSLEM